MSSLNVQAAYDYYREHILRTEFFDLLAEHNLKTAGSIPGVAWELFGSILTGKQGSPGYGSDLEGIEIKSAKKRASFEYQYHLNTGIKKLEEDIRVDHYFCSYEADYNSFCVYHVAGKVLAAQYFSKWIPEYRRNYSTSIPASKRRQRFRRNIPYGLVSKTGTTIMEVVGGKLLKEEKNIGKVKDS